MVQQALGARRRSGRWGALLFIDVDNFKDLIDTVSYSTPPLARVPRSMT